VFTVIGQILTKKGAIQLNETQGFFFTNKFIIIGLLAAVLAAGSWIKALQVFDLSYAYPFMSLSFFFVSLLSLFFFGETIKSNQWMGLAVVIFGLYIGSR
jgi:drug/metabolite transporter (DMT)-like permease